MVGVIDGEKTFDSVSIPSLSGSLGETVSPAAGGRNFPNIRPTIHSRSSKQLAHFNFVPLVSVSRFFSVTLSLSPHIEYRTHISTAFPTSRTTDRVFIVDQRIDPANFPFRVAFSSIRERDPCPAFLT